jgi:hypothetical protein
MLLAGMEKQDFELNIQSGTGALYVKVEGAAALTAVLRLTMYTVIDFIPDPRYTYLFKK